MFKKRGENVWSDKAIDYSAGVIKTDKTIIPKKIGCFVKSYEYAVAWQKKWKPPQDL